MLKAILIDDEPHCIGTLAILLGEYCPQVQIVAQCSDALRGVEAIKQHQPNIVFLDIEMPRMNGFQLLEQFENINFHIVFTTAYDQYALRAFRFCALDYLLKPVDYEELIKTVEKAERISASPIQQNQIELFKESFFQQKTPQRIALPRADGYEFFNPIDIMYCEGDNNYTRFCISDGSSCLVSRTLKEIENTLTDWDFFRVHKQFLINPKHIKRYIKNDGGYIIMNDGKNVAISRNRKEDFEKLFMKM